MPRALWFALAPWPAVTAGLYLFHSAALTFALYASVCLFGAWRLGGLSRNTLLKPTLPLQTHLLLAIAANIVLIGLYRLFGAWLLPTEKLAESLAAIGVTRASFVWLFPYFLIGNPLVEELFWRGSVRERWSAVAFGAWHALVVFLLAPWWVAILATLGIIGVGAVLTEITRRTNTLGDAILIHALAADLPLLIILWQALS